MEPKNEAAPQVPVGAVRDVTPAWVQARVIGAGFLPDTPLPVVADWYEERGQDKTALALRRVAAGEIVIVSFSWPRD